jgi:predicted DNA-binding transcriptional regulator AlpA
MRNTACGSCHPPDRRRRCLKAALRVSDSPDDHKAPHPPVTRPDDAPVGRVGPLEVSVAALVANPTRTSEVPVHQIPALVAELASEQATLCALQGALTTRLLASTAAEAASHKSDDRLLTVDEVASTLGVNRRWVQRRAKRLPFARRISEHSIRYSEAGLKRWMATDRFELPSRGLCEEPSAGREHLSLVTLRAFSGSGAARRS